jgi:signal transduction histidine kinase
MSDPGFHPLRFVWQMDAEGRFTVGSEDFVALVGPRTAAVLGEPWHAIASALDLDRGGQIARAMATQDTWSGLAVAWPVDDGSRRLMVELSGLPVFDRDRVFRGYRGFGVCRDLAPVTIVAEAAAPQAENVVPFRPPAADATAPALSPVEHSAFRELSRRLTERLNEPGGEPAAAAAAEPAVAGQAAPSAFVRAPGAVELPADAAPIAAIAHDARSILDQLPVGILVYRLDHLLYANPAFLRWSGHKTLHGLAESGGLDSLFVEASGADAGNGAPVPLTIDRGDGLRLTAELTKIVWEDEPAHALVTAAAERAASTRAELEAARAEIAAGKLAEAALTEARQQADKASAAKSDFLAKISHEIRDPLNAIIGFSEVMMEERFGPIGNERYRQYLRDIHNSGGHLISLINDLLDLSKIEAGKLDLAFATVALDDVTQQAVALMQPQANREHIIIRTALSPKLPPIVADARSVKQIVLNLVSNSIKFTAAGGQVIVSTALTDLGEVVLRVRDTGIGMSEQDIATALEPFRQLATSPRLGAGGTGLGLPLTKALAEANRAAFRITSARNAGTLVEVTFPVTRVVAG